MSGQAVLNPPPLNQLYDAASGATFLKNQEATQTVGANDIAMTARAAAPLLNMSEEDAAAAYPGVVANLRANGFGQHAPTTYPGHATTTALVQRGMTVPEQYQYGLLTAPGVADALKAATAPLTTAAPGGGGGAGTGTASGGGGDSTTETADDLTRAAAVRDGLIKRGMPPDGATAFAANALH